MKISTRNISYTHSFLKFMLSISVSKMSYKNGRCIQETRHEEVNGFYEKRKECDILSVCCDYNASVVAYNYTFCTILLKYVF